MLWHGRPYGCGFIGDQNVVRGNRMAVARRGSERHGDGFAGP